MASDYCQNFKNTILPEWKYSETEWMNSCQLVERIKKDGKIEILTVL